MNKSQYKANIAYLERHDIRYCGLAWEDKKFSAELETYTDAGEDMIIDLEVLDKKHLQEYIDNFDINENVMVWWREGERHAHEKGVPFDNIKDHYEDYEAYLKTLQNVCDNWCGD